ncbi:coth protein-domain-containing protein [Gilbertella persicaria]|uniref:coth protein-domain-containing protein n=1 Tax=Gilbertella persicaria TaxID=101096 RepID=UPI00221E4062|nr:coth protein-domain-containing protein [Gilbertella persicaria]KAI8091034.1 coth protein-domain-containing protein [Gilbertella persicaria]
MAVLIDQGLRPYLLSLDKADQSRILYSGKAPVALKGYSYAVVDTDTGSIIEREPFTRNPINMDTLNEFYSRTWNTFSISRLPSLFSKLQSINQIDSDLHQYDQIPTLHLFGEETDVNKMHNNISSDIEISLGLTYIGVKDVKNFGHVKVKISGRGTRYSTTKPSYKIKLAKTDNLYGNRAIKLRSLQTDPSFVREKLYYDLLESVGLASIQSSYVRVFINNKSYGLFGLQDIPNETWIDNKFHHGSHQNNIVFYGGTCNATLDYLGENESAYQEIKCKPFYDPVYKIKSKGSRSFVKLIDFTRFIDQMSANSTAASWNKYMDIESFIRSVSLEVVLGNADGYLLSAHNFLLYSNPKQHGQFIFIPQDADMSLGRTFTISAVDLLKWFDLKYLIERISFPLFRKIMVVSELRELFLQTTIKIARAVSSASFMNYVDSIAEMISQDVNWDLTIPRNYTGGYPTDIRHMNDAGLFQESLKVALPLDLIKDYYASIIHPVSFKTAIDEPIYNHLTLIGVKQWIKESSNSIMSFSKTL